MKKLTIENFRKNEMSMICFCAAYVCIVCHRGSEYAIHFRKNFFVGENDCPEGSPPRSRPYFVTTDLVRLDLGPYFGDHIWITIHQNSLEI